MVDARHKKAIRRACTSAYFMAIRTESVKVADVTEVHYPATEVGSHFRAAPVAFVLHELLRSRDNGGERGSIWHECVFAFMLPERLGGMKTT